ncbi:PAS domain-containing protein [bacterium]|nr:PAS domain-containing protein [bacterium]
MTNVNLNSVSEPIDIAAAVRTAIEDVLYVIDPNGRFIDANDKCCRILGVEYSAISSLVLDDFIDNQDRQMVDRAREQIVNARKSARMILPLRSAGGGRQVLEVIESPLQQNGQVIGIVGVGRDVTEEDAIEAKLWESQEDRESALAYAVEASLGMIRGYVYSLQNLDSLPVSLHDRYRSVLIEEIETLGRSVENLLQGRSPSDYNTAAELCNVQDIVNEVQQAMQGEARRRDIDLTVTPSESEVLLYTKPDAVWRMLANLVDYCMLRIIHAGDIRMMCVDCEEYVEIRLNSSGPMPTQAEINGIMTDTCAVPSDGHGSPNGSKVDLFIARVLCNALGGGIMVNAADGGRLELIAMLPRHVQQLGVNYPELFESNGR